jgi:hypothetical protein
MHDVQEKQVFLWLGPALGTDLYSGSGKSRNPSTGATSVTGLREQRNRGSWSKNSQVSPLIRLESKQCAKEP